MKKLSLFIACCFLAANLNAQAFFTNKEVSILDTTKTIAAPIKFHVITWYQGVSTDMKVAFCFWLTPTVKLNVKTEMTIYTDPNVVEEMIKQGLCAYKYEFAVNTGKNSWINENSQSVLENHRTMSMMLNLMRDVH